MDNNSDDNKNWGTIIRQVMRDMGGEVHISDEEFLERVENLAEKKGRDIPSAFPATVRRQIYSHTKGGLQKSQSDKKYFSKVGRGVYRLLDVTDSIFMDKIKKENEEFRNIFNNPKLTEKERKEKYTVHKARVGHGPFRDELYKKWGGCSVTGYDQKELLIASHIKPWSVSEKEENFKEQIDIENGFLLTANLDKAFDRGFISFKDDGTIKISEKLSEGSKIGITLKLKLRKISETNKVYLKYHRDEIFQPPEHRSA